MPNHPSNPELRLPALFDTDEPLFITSPGNAAALPTLTLAELRAMDGTGGEPPTEGDDS